VAARRVRACSRARPRAWRSVELGGDPGGRRLPGGLVAVGFLGVVAISRSIARYA
jgi:hypothetical protein